MGERNLAEEVGYLVAALEILAEDDSQDALLWLNKYRSRYGSPLRDLA